MASDADHLQGGNEGKKAKFLFKLQEFSISCLTVSHSYIILINQVQSNNLSSFFQFIIQNTDQCQPNGFLACKWR